MADLAFSAKRDADSGNTVVDFSYNDATGHVEFDDTLELSVVIGFLQGLQNAQYCLDPDDDEDSAGSDTDSDMI